MPKGEKIPPILCAFDPNGECLEEMIQKSFQAFIHRYLQDGADFLTRRP